MEIEDSRGVPAVEPPRSGRERLTAFRPDPVRGRALYREVKRRVTGSFREVAAASRTVAEFDQAGLNALLAGAERAEHVSARLFGAYYDVLGAIDRDDIDAASEIFTELVERGCASGAAEYHDFADDDLGGRCVARYRRLIDTDAANSLNLVAAGPGEFERITRLADQAMDLLDSGAPEVAGEIRALISEIIFAAGRPGSQTVFHGVSSFLTWGAIFVNAGGHQTTLELLQTLAHESSHLHLFGVALDEPLVLNADDERHASPLRRDPRPMGGVYHATYISARMHYALARLLESGALDAAQRQQAGVDLADHAKTFGEGLATIEAHGRLSELGSELLASAKEYMTG